MQTSCSKATKLGEAINLQEQVIPSMHNIYTLNISLRMVNVAAISVPRQTFLMATVAMIQY